MSEEERSRLLAEYAALNSDPFAEVSELAEEEPAEKEPAEKEEEKNDLVSEYAIPDSAFDREKILEEIYLLHTFYSYHVAVLLLLPSPLEHQDISSSV